MHAVISALLPVMLLIALGFALRKGNFIPAEQWRGIEQLCYWMLFPALLIVTLARSKVSFASLSGFAVALFLMVIVLTILAYALRVPLMRWLGMSGPTFTSVFQTSTRWHGFVAFAIVERLFGLEGVAIIAIAFAAMIPWLNVANVLVLALHAGKVKATPALVARALLKNPFLWGIALGLTWKLSGAPAEGVVMSTLELVGRGALGISLLALGAGLSLRALKSARREVLVTMGMKLVLAPLLAMALGKAFGVTGPPFVIMVVAAAVPTAVAGYVLARAMGGDAEFYAAAATAQVVASFLTMPLFITLAYRLA